MFDPEQLILEVEKRPLLYDNDAIAIYGGSGGRDRRKETWREVAETLLPGWNHMAEEEQNLIDKELRKQWKETRDKFLKQIKNDDLSLTLSSDLFYKLNFLIPHVGASKATSSVTREKIRQLKNTVRKSQKKEKTRTPKKKPVRKARVKRIKKEPHHAEVHTALKLEKNDNIPIFCDTLDNAIENSYTRRRKRSAPGSDTEVTATKVILQTNEEQTEKPRLYTAPILEQSASRTSDEVQFETPEANKSLVNVQMKGTNKPTDPFGNEAFLMSFLPIMNNLPPNLFIKARRKITEAFDSFIETHLSNGFVPVSSGETGSRCTFINYQGGQQPNPFRLSTNPSAESNLNVSKQ